MTPCGSWRVTRFVGSGEAELAWCQRTAGPCPYSGAPASRSRGDNRPCAAISPPAPPVGFTGSLSTNGTNPQPLAPIVDSPPPCGTCHDTGIAGYSGRQTLPMPLVWRIRKAQPMSDIESVANDPASAAHIAQQQADFAASQAAPTTGGDPIDYVANTQGKAYNTIDELFPPGWGSEGETPEGTTWNNAVESLWLPLILPDATEGPWGNFPVKPHGIFYADTKSGVVDSTATGECGPAHSSPEVDQCRVDVAARFALDAASGTGTVGVRETG